MKKHYDCDDCERVYDGTTLVGWRYCQTHRDDRDRARAEWKTRDDDIGALWRMLETRGRA